MNILSSNLRMLRLRASFLSTTINTSQKIHTPSSILFSKNPDPKPLDFTTTSLQSSYELNRQNLNLPVVTQQTMMHKFKEFLGLQGDLKYPQPVLTIASYRLYMCIQYQVDYEKFFKLCQSPDVMYSFCLINFLHIWLLSVPLMQFGQTGLYVRKALYKNMWKDIETRDRKLKRPMNKKNKVNTYTHLNDIFRGFLIGFDEGLLSDDTVLAGAVWRHLLEMNEIEDYAVLGQMCDYIRKNAQHLDEIPEVDYLKHGIVSFIDLEQSGIDHLKVRKQLIEKIHQKEREE